MVGQNERKGVRDQDKRLPGTNLRLPLYGLKSILLGKHVFSSTSGLLTKAVITIINFCLLGDSSQCFMFLQVLQAEIQAIFIPGYHFKNAFTVQTLQERESASPS